MKIVPAMQVEPEEVPEQGAQGASVRWLLSRKEGAPTVALRLFEIQPGGCTPFHHHAWEHEVFVLEGRVEVVAESGPVLLSPWDALLVFPDEQHQFRNTGEAPARLLCLIPLPKEQ